MAEDKKKDEIAVIEINEEFMKQKLYEFRGCKVLLDADLAEVYGYELKAFNQQVKRNIERFQRNHIRSRRRILVLKFTVSVDRS